MEALKPLTDAVAISAWYCSEVSIVLVHYWPKVFQSFKEFPSPSDVEKVLPYIICWVSMSTSQYVALRMWLDDGFLIPPLLFTLGNFIGCSFRQISLLTHCDLGQLPMMPITIATVFACLRDPRWLCLMQMTLYSLWWLSILVGMGFHPSAIGALYRFEKTQFLRMQRAIAYADRGYISLATEAAPLTAPEKNEKGKVRVVRTSKADGTRLTPQGSLDLNPGGPPKAFPHVIVNTKERYQTCLGFGGAFTESSAELVVKMSSAKQERLIDACFSASTGLGYTLGRVHMNSCDFSRGNWTCCEEGDTELKTFNIDHYKKEIIPMIKRAVQAAGKPLTLFASPWSAPGWMKDTGKMPQGGNLQDEMRGVWANYFVKFADAFKAVGYPLWGFSVQNEPDGEQRWESLLYNPEQERDFIRDHLGPTLQAAHPDLKIVCWDHNRDDMFLRANVIYSDPEASKYVWGMGYHWYGDVRHDWWAPSQDGACFDNVRRVQELRPDKHLMITEVCQESGSHIGDWKVAERYGETILLDFNNGTGGFCDWNLILNIEGGFNWTDNNCSAPILVDTDKDKVLLNPSYYFIGHFSRYIQPGAQRVACATNRSALKATAWINPDGSGVVVTLNYSKDEIWFCLQIDGKNAYVPTPPDSMMTFTFLAENE